jgi:hypothetical protein
MSSDEGNGGKAGSDKKEEKTYAVEKILKRRMKAGKAEYLVKWMGYGESENSWEPEENFVEVRIGEREWLLSVSKAL